METHTCVSTDGVTFTCPICGRVYTFRNGESVIIRQGNPDAVHMGTWGVLFMTVDATTIPFGPARPELFGKN